MQRDPPRANQGTGMAALGARAILRGGLLTADPKEGELFSHLRGKVSPKVDTEH